MKIKTIYNYRRSILCIYALLFTVLTHAGPHIRFSKNAGQWNDSVLYRADLGNGAVFLEKQKFTFLFYSEEWFNSIGHNKLHNTLHQHDSTHQHRSSETAYTHHAYQLEFIGSNPSAEIQSEEVLPYYENYFIGNNPEKWASNVLVCSQVRYKNLYHGIDLLVYQNEEGFKYDFIISPGANPNDIVIQINGALAVGVNKQKGLDIITAVNQVTERRPYAFSKHEGREKSVACGFEALEKNTIHFKLGKYKNQDTLVIDPELIFSTYSGSTADNWGFTATYDQGSYVYSGGVIFGQSYPFSLGPYQRKFNGGENDIAIYKVDSIGRKLQYATYIGGASSEMPHSMIVNSKRELVLYGTTGSPDFPIASNAYSSTFKGGPKSTYDGGGFVFDNGCDIYVLKLSPDGQELRGGTFYGGSLNDGLNYKQHIEKSFLKTMHGNDSLYYNYGDGARGEITVDDKDNVYIGTCTFSTDCPMINSLQSNNRGNEEGLLLKFSPDLSNLEWSSYIGGSQDDAVYSVDVDKSQNLYFTGGTSSQDLSTSTTAYKTTYQGGNTDAFVGKLSSNGSTIEGLSYFGSDVYDQAYFVRIDKKRAVHIYGQTKASGSSLIFNAGYSNPNSGQFLAKFSNTLDKLEWSTVFGSGNGKPNISPTAFSVDMCHRIYLAGAGRDWPYGYIGGRFYFDWRFVVDGTKNMPITNNAYQKNTDGQDFYFMVLTDNAQGLDYASYLGEINGATGNNCSSDDYYAGTDHVDGGTARFDKRGNIYQAVCASCRGCQGFPIKPKPGAVSEINGSTNCNNAVLRFQIHFDMLTAEFETPDVLCDPYSRYFINKSVSIDTQNVRFIWDFGDGSPISNEKSPTHKYKKEGNFNVCLVVQDLTSCNLVDTLCKTISVSEKNRHTILPKREICVGDTIQIGLDQTDTIVERYRWNPKTSLSNDTLPNPLAWPQKTTKYVLTITTPEPCVRTVEQTVDVSDFSSNPYKLSYTIEPTNVCENLPTTIRLHSNAPTRAFVISTSPLYLNNLLPTQRDSVLTLQVTKDTILYIKSYSKRCQQSDSATIKLHPITMVAIQNKTADSVCINTKKTLKALAVGVGANVIYRWEPASLVDSGQNGLNARFIFPKSTKIKITATNTITGCKNSDSIYISIDSPKVKLLATPISCFGQIDGKISSIANGIAPFQYKWHDGATQDTRNFLNKGRWKVTLTDNMQCTDTASIEIKEPAIISISAKKTKPACYNVCDGQISLDVKGGTPPYVYQWDNGNTTNSNLDLCPNNYTVKVTDVNLCESSKQFAITQDIKVSVTTNDNVICTGNQTKLQANIAPPTTGILYEWRPAINILQGKTTNNPSVKVDSTTQFLVIARNPSSGCESRDSITIRVDTILSAIKVKSISCYGKNDGSIEVSLNGIAPYSIVWSNGEITQTRNALKKGVYNVTISDALCQIQKSFSINEPDSLFIQTQIQAHTCPFYCNGTATAIPAGGTKPYFYRWANSHDSIAKRLCTGTYSVTVHDINNCTRSQTITIPYSEHIPQLAPEAHPPYIYQGQQAWLYALPQAETKTTYHWYPNTGLNSPDKAHTLFISDSTMFYMVEATDQFGCSNTDTISLAVRNFVCNEPFIFVPNTFTPNGDGKNDVLPVSSKIVSSLDFKIFDRWGELVFETTDASKAWDGTFKSAPVSAGVYVYHIKATCINGEKFEKKGDISVIR